MWVYIISTYVLTLIASRVASNESVNNEQSVSSLPTNQPISIRVIWNNTLNSSLMETQLQEQNSLSNTSFQDVQNDNHTQQNQHRFRERKRQERLFLIQTQILQRLGITGRAVNTTNAFNHFERDLLDRVVHGVSTTAVTGVNEISSAEVLSERRQSFYPSCSIPNHTDPILWNLNSEEMKLYYDISFALPSQSRSQVTALSAKLRIYKFNDPPSEATPINNILSDRIHQFVSQQGLTISLYQYMRPLRQNRRERKRLIDSRTVSSNYRGYIEFNAINAINYWHYNRLRNFGLYVDIEDPYGVHLSASLYLSQMNCSVQDTPMPNLADILPNVENETALFYNQSYPTLDLFYIETAKDQKSVSQSVVNVSEVTSRRKRLAQTFNHKDKCEVQKTHISVKDLNLEDIIIYPTSLETVICTGHCHKHRILEKLIRRK